MKVRELLKELQSINPDFDVGINMNSMECVDASSVQCINMLTPTRRTICTLIPNRSLVFPEALSKEHQKKLGIGISETSQNPEKYDLLYQRKVVGRIAVKHGKAVLKTISHKGKKGKPIFTYYANSGYKDTLTAPEKNFCLERATNALAGYLVEEEEKKQAQNINPDRLRLAKIAEELKRYFHNCSLMRVEPDLDKINKIIS